MFNFSLLHDADRQRRLCFETQTLLPFNDASWFLLERDSSLSVSIDRQSFEQLCWRSKFIVNADRLANFLALFELHTDETRSVDFLSLFYVEFEASLRSLYFQANKSHFSSSSSSSSTDYETIHLFQVLLAFSLPADDKKLFFFLSTLQIDFNEIFVTFQIVLNDNLYETNDATSDKDDSNSNYRHRFNDRKRNLFVDRIDGDFLLLLRDVLLNWNLRDIVSE